MNKQIIDKLWQEYRKYCLEKGETANHIGSSRIEMFLAWLEKKYG